MKKTLLTLLKITLGTLFLMLAYAAPGRAAPACTAGITWVSDTITGTNGVFDYDVSTTCQLSEDTEFTIGTTGGLASGVNGESVPSGSYLGMNGVFADTFSSTSASFQASDPINASSGDGTLVVDCSNCAAGDVSWSIVAGSTFTGTDLTGPVAAATATAAPEPSSLLLLITGLAALSALAVLARRTASAPACPAGRLSVHTPSHAPRGV